MGLFTRHSVSALRALVTSAVLRRADHQFNGQTLEQWIQQETGLTADKYAQAVQRGLWGGVVEMQLLADELRRPFVVYAKQGHSKEAHKIIEVHPVRDECADAGPIVLLYQGRVHYDALLRTS